MIKGDTNCLPFSRSVFYRPFELGM